MKERERARLQGLLTKATSGRARCVGGAPRSLPPAGGRGSMPAIEPARSPQARSASAAPGLGPRGEKALPGHTEKAGQYVKKLLGHDSSGGGAQDWRLVQELDIVDGLLQEEHGRRQLAAQKEFLRNQLANQNDNKSYRVFKEREDNRRWGERLRQDSENFWQEQAQKRDAEREAQIQFNVDQRYYLECNRLRRQEEKEKEMEIERQMAETSAAARKVELARMEEKKRKAQEQTQKMVEQREQAREAAKERQRQEALRERELAKEQQAMMDKQDRDRREKVEKIKAKQAATMARMEAGPSSYGAMLETQKKDEERAKRAVAELARREDQKIQEKEEKIKQCKIEGQASAKAQIEALREKRAKEREDNLRMARDSQRETEAAIDAEKALIQSRREKAKANADYLLKQMQDKSGISHSAFGPEQMNAVEKSLNRDRLDRAQNSESLQILFRSKQLQNKLLTSGGSK